MFRRLAYSLALLPVALHAAAQAKGQTDSLVRLLGCDELQQIEEFGRNYRKALGNARFEHNSTLLICDTAIWDVGLSIINAYGNVRVIQNETVLTSDNLDYYIDRDLAQFRGTLVQLQDKKNNTLRTQFLDYNTKDSVAVFQNGAAFRDEDGQVIESDNGSYDSKIKLFKFNGRVNMYTDTIFVKTDNLDYNTDDQMAFFGHGTHAWRDDNMLSASAGWYDRRNEIFLFYDQVHVLTETQEAWADSLKYYRNTRNAEMFGNAQLIDTTRDISAVAGYLYYNDSLSLIKMTRDPAVIAVSVQKEKRDTAYVGADTLLYWTVPRCDVDSTQIRAAESRMQSFQVDPIFEYRRKAAEDARAAAAEALKKMEEGDPDAAGAIDRGREGARTGAATQSARQQGGSTVAAPPAQQGSPPRRRTTTNLPAQFDEMPAPYFPKYSFRPQSPDSLAQQAATAALDSLATPPDSLLTPPDSLLFPLDSAVIPRDSLAVADSLAGPRDSTKIGFLLGLNNVKVFRRDMQVVCDSLAYTDLDSLVRLYRSPIVWNEIRHQYSADSITVIIKDQILERASLMSNAFIIVQEDSSIFDQIRGAEMMAFFDSTGTLTRFDSMGGASGLFFIKENDAFATVNKFEAKMLTASFRDGNLYDMHYFEDVKSDAYPVVQVKKEDKTLKGYDWQPELRPKDPTAITTLQQRPSERAHYEAIPLARFPQTDLYFPGYMKSVHEMLAQQDSIREARRIEQRRLEELQRETERARADSLAVADSLVIADSLAVSDSLGVLSGERLAGLDSLSMVSGTALAPADSVGVASPDSLASPAISLTREQIDSLSAISSLSVFDRQEAERKARRLAAAEKRAEKEKARQSKLDLKNARWAELEARDSLKAQAKAEKQLQRKRAQTLEKVIVLKKQEAREQKFFERYKARFERRKARKEARKAAKAAKGTGT